MQPESKGVGGKEHMYDMEWFSQVKKSKYRRLHKVCYYSCRMGKWENMFAFFNSAYKNTGRINKRLMNCDMSEKMKNIEV